MASVPALKLSDAIPDAVALTADSEAAGMPVTEAVKGRCPLLALRFSVTPGTGSPCV